MTESKRSCATRELLAASAMTLFLSFSSSPVFAQNAEPDCMVKPGNETHKSLSSKLDDCNSVLEPPEVGDGEIVAPVKQTGTMPVLKPGDLPDDKNPDTQK
ncbi:hypothetical protein [Pararhizobium antarcticum]|nr:hypothetical protein [Pararhizobium antarcticum]